MATPVTTQEMIDSVSIINDFPKPGICFRDISTMLKNTRVREHVFDLLAKHYSEDSSGTKKKDLGIDVIAGIDARGFIFGTALASRLNLEFLMIRKPSKLPGNIISVDYGLEYGTNTLCIQKEGISPGQRVLILDDLLATGGSAGAAAALIEKAGGVVAGLGFFIELIGLEGRKILSAKYDVHALLKLPVDGTNPKPEDLAATPAPPVKTSIRTSIQHLFMGANEKVDHKTDMRTVVFCHPSAASLCKNLCATAPDKFRQGEITWSFFPDGWPNIRFEHMKFLEGRHVVFIGSLTDMKQITEQLSFMMVLPRQFVASLSIVFPYYPPATMERVEEEGILATAETVAKLISASIPITRSGPASLRIFDIHALPVRFYFADTVMMRMMTAVPLLIEKIAKTDLAICFPDDGAAKRFKSMFSNFPIVVCAKVREDDKRIVKVTDTLNFPKDYKINHVLIVDDLVQSGGTLDECRKALVAYGAVKVSAFTTHPVFPNQSYTRFMPGGDRSGLEAFYVTNTIPEVSEQLEGKAPFVVLKIDKMLADDILCIVDKKY